MGKTVADSWDTLAGRLRWAIERQPRQGRQRGLRLFQRRMEEHGADVPGTSLSAIQVYLRDDSDVEPAPRFLELAARLLGVRAAWLAWGTGAPTEEQEAVRRASPEDELSEAAGIVLDALGVPRWDPRGLEVPTWAPSVLQAAHRLRRERLTRDLSIDESTYPLVAAVGDVAKAIAAPLHAVGIHARYDLPEAERDDYVQSVSLALQRAVSGLHQPIPESSDGDDQED